MTLQDLLDQYPLVRLATPADNSEILGFVSGIAMRTQKGGLGIERGPDFFALGQAQGERSYTFLFRNADDSLGGVGCISTMPMQIQGQKQTMAYAGDLKLSRKIDPETRKQFYLFYQSLMENFAKLQEFKGCRHVVNAILDDNEVAKRALVNSKSKKHPLIHRPFYSYENINILGRIPLPTALTQTILSGKQVGEEAILQFLTSNVENSELVWTREEIKRRQQVAGFAFDDFLVEVDPHNHIVACGLLLSDFQYRKMKVSPMPKSLKWGQILTQWLGQPKIVENQPIKVGYLSFVKIRSQNVKQRAHTLHSFLQRVRKQQSQLPKSERFQILHLLEPKGNGVKQELVRKGYICNSFSSTLYQVETPESSDHPLAARQQRLDFDMVFH